MMIPIPPDAISRQWTLLRSSAVQAEVWCELARGYASRGLPWQVCEQRDPKGMYRRARAGEIAGFTGVSSPYEAPEHPELIVKTAEHPLDLCVAQVLECARKAIGFS